MPTLFVVVAKNLICRELEAKITASQAKDDQRILGLVPIPQNKELAVKKRNILIALSTSITQLPEAEDDLTAARKLIEELTVCKTKTTAAALESSQSSSATEAMLVRLKAFVTSFYEKLKGLKLLNQPEEIGPFYTFLTAMAAYHADRLFEKTAPPSFFSNPNISCINDYHRVIDNLVDEKLRIALENLNGQNKEDEGYVERKDALGILNIEYMILKNQAIREKYKLTVTNALSWLPAVLEPHLCHAELILSSKAGAALAPTIDPDVLALEEDDLLERTGSECGF